MNQILFCTSFVLGRGELEIEGDRWTYPSKEEEGAKTKYYRIVNLFQERIAFTSSVRPDPRR